MAESTGRIIAVANQKGGAGKTTVAVNLAATLGSMGQRVLLIDVDPQADATDLTGSRSLPEATIYNVLDKLAETRTTAAEAIVPTALAGVELLPGDERLAATEKHLAGDAFAATALARALTTDVRDRYDTVILDCPPNLGLITINAIVAADDVLCVVSMVDRNAYKGAIRLRDTVDELNSAGGQTRFIGIVRNHVDHRLQVYKLLSAALTDDASLPVLETEIPKGAKFQTATAIGQPLSTWQPENFGSYAMRQLAQEILATEVPRMTKLELNTQGLRKGGTLQALLGADLAASATPPSPEGGGEVPAAAPTPESGGRAEPSSSPEGLGATASTSTAPNARAGARQPSEPQPTPDLQDQPFWAIGALEQTSVAVDPILLTTINALAADLELPVATVFAAIVHQGLPADIDAAADAVLLEQADHPGRGREYNLRLPVELKARLAALLKGASVQIGRANRADLINAALRAGMPQDTDQARELCVTYRRRQTLARRAEPVRAAHQ